MQELDLAPPMFVDVQLGLHVGPEQLEQGLSQKLLPVHAISSSSWAALSDLSSRDLTCHVGGILRWSPLSLGR